MVRRADKDRLEAIASVVQENPGIKPGAVADLLGLHRSAVTRALPALEEAGILLVEDDQGRLSFFGRRS
jgi:Mn-dependent DtxR family transcriptional regulator